MVPARPHPTSDAVLCDVIHSEALANRQSFFLVFWGVLHESRFGVIADAAELELSQLWRLLS